MKEKFDSPSDDVNKIRTASVTVSNVVNRVTLPSGTCPCLLLRGNVSSTSPCNNNVNCSHQSRSSQQSDLNNSLIRRSDSQLESPLYIETKDRLPTFTNWPSDSHQKPEVIAEAGLYYLDYSDCVRCFCCGGKLRGWEKEDNPWIEHAKWFPDCHFVIEQRGHYFVNTVQELKKRSDKITYQMVQQEMRKSQSMIT